MPPGWVVLSAEVGLSCAGHQNHGEALWSKPWPELGRETDGGSGRNPAGQESAHSRFLLGQYRFGGGASDAMELFIGPLIERNGGYSYDTFTLGEGLRSSFRYLRLDAARYDQRALIAEARRDPQYDVHISDTQAEFDELVEATRRGITEVKRPN